MAELSIEEQARALGYEPQEATGGWPAAGGWPACWKSNTRIPVYVSTAADVVAIHAPKRVVCSACGSDNITCDALARWSVEEQCWELSSELDHTDCGDCGAEDCAKFVRT